MEKEGNSHGVRSNWMGRLGQCEADSRCGTGVSIGLKRDRDKGKVRGGWSAAGIGNMRSGIELNLT
jgi:hypothetical protein